MLFFLILLIAQSHSWPTNFHVCQSDDNMDMCINDGLVCAWCPSNSKCSKWDCKKNTTGEHCDTQVVLSSNYQKMCSSFGDRFIWAVYLTILVGMIIVIITAICCLVVSRILKKRRQEKVIRRVVRDYGTSGTNETYRIV